MQARLTQSGIAILGGGGHAKVVIATLMAAGEEVGGVFDDLRKPGEKILGVPILDRFEACQRSGFRRAVIALGDNASRRDVAERFALDWVSVVHPGASVHASVELGAGTVVFAGAVIQPETRIGKHAIVNTAASIDHDCSLGDFVHAAPGSHLAGGITVGQGALMGIGSVAKPGVSIGSWAVVGAGGVVVSDVPPGVQVVGVPARARRTGAPSA